MTGCLSTFTQLITILTQPGVPYTLFQASVGHLHPNALRDIRGLSSSPPLWTSLTTSLRNQRIVLDYACDYVCWWSNGDNNNNHNTVLKNSIHRLAQSKLTKVMITNFIYMLNSILGEEAQEEQQPPPPPPPQDDDDMDLDFEEDNNHFRKRKRNDNVETPSSSSSCFQW